MVLQYLGFQYLMELQDHLQEDGLLVVVEVVDQLMEMVVLVVVLLQ